LLQLSGLIMMMLVVIGRKNAAIMEWQTHCWNHHLCNSKFDRTSLLPVL